MFSCVNTSRGEISEADTLGAALLAAYTHLVEDREEPPIVVCEDSEPVVCFTFMPVGRGEIVRATIKEATS